MNPKLGSAGDTIGKAALAPAGFDFNNVPSFEEMEALDIAARPYEVWHPEAESTVPTFKTWPEAREAAKKWNRDCPGHIARRRFPAI